MKQLFSHYLRSALRRMLHIACLPFPPIAPRVLVYHSVDSIDSPISITPELFEQQMDYLVKKRYTTWTASQMVDAIVAGKPLPRRLVVITFDDGYLNNITHALPIMEKRGICGTLFMVTQNAGDTARWTERDLPRIRKMIDALFPGDDNAKRAAEQEVMATLDEKMATWDELRPAPERGLEVLSHTRTHPYMDEVDDEQLTDELAGSRRDLDEQGFGGGNSIAWPYGKYDDRAIEAAAAAGYTGTFLGRYEWDLRHHRDPMRIHRVGADPARGVFGLAFILGRGYDVLQWLKRLRPEKEF